MNLNQLNPLERAVLAELTAHMVDADGETSVEEVQEMLEIEEEMEDETFIASIDASRGTPLDETLEKAKLLTNPEARELIRTVLHDLAAVDGLVREESEVLQKLAEAWKR